MMTRDMVTLMVVFLVVVLYHFLLDMVYRKMAYISPTPAITPNSMEMMTSSTPDMNLLLRDGVAPHLDSRTSTVLKINNLEPYRRCHRRI